MDVNQYQMQADFHLRKTSAYFNSWLVNIEHLVQNRTHSHHQVQ